MTRNARLIPFDRFWTGRPYGEPPSPDLGLVVLHQLAMSAAAREYEPDQVPDDLDELLDARLDLKIAAVECLDYLAGPIVHPYGQRRRAERDRELDRIALMIAEAWAALRSYNIHRTRGDAADLLGRSSRQLRTREKLLRRALDYFGLDFEVRSDYVGRPPGRR